MNNNKYSLGILDVLLIVFIVLKLVGVITWAWKIVLIPLWIEIAMGVIMGIAYIYYDMRG